MRRACRQDQCGVTLIEAMVAVVVFAIAAVGLFAHITYSRTMLNSQNHRRAVAEIAHSRLELLRTVPYSSLTGYAETDTALDVETIDGAAVPGTRTTGVQDVDEDGDGTDDYRLITVTVAWQGGGQTHSVTLSTIRSTYR